jgi:hypothetical protein
VYIIRRVIVVRVTHGGKAIPWKGVVAHRCITHVVVYDKTLTHLSRRKITVTNKKKY